MLKITKKYFDSYSRDYSSHKFLQIFSSANQLQSTILVEKEVLVETEVLVEKEVLVAAEVLVETEVLVAAEVLVETEVLVEAKVLVETDVLVETEALVEAGEDTWMSNSGQPAGMTPWFPDAVRVPQLLAIAPAVTVRVLLTQIFCPDFPLSVERL